MYTIDQKYTLASEFKCHGVQLLSDIFLPVESLDIARAVNYR